MKELEQKHVNRNEKTGICIDAVSYYVPNGKSTVTEILINEEMKTETEFRTRDIGKSLGIEKVPICLEETSSDLAYKAATRAIEKSSITPDEINVVVDFTSLPEEYVVPSWSMANKLQHELGAKNAFTLGFSGNGSTSLLVAIKFTMGIMTADPNIKTALLLAGEKAVGGKRVLNYPETATICGDGASAMVLRKVETSRKRILGTQLRSVGQLHDVLNIPAGGYLNPLDSNNYQLVINMKKYNDFFADQSLHIFNGLIEKLLNPFKLNINDIKYFICPNISKVEQRKIVTFLNLKERQILEGKIATHGHIQSTDLIINYLSATEEDKLEQGDYIILFSHGFGFTWGMTLIQY